MRKVVYFSLVLLLILVAASCNMSGKDDERYVTFNSNGGKGEMPSQLYMVGVSQKLSSNAFAKDGYRFKNWNTKKDNSGTSYKNGENISFESGDENIILYANWTHENTYTIRYVDVLNPDFYMDQDVKRDVPSNLISAEELGIKDSHPGYTLDLTKLWNTKRDGTGTMYADQAVADNLTEAGNTITLYAQWHTKITYDKNGGELNDHGEIPEQEMVLNNTVTVGSNKFDQNSDYYKYDGAYFIGWTTLPSNQIDGKFYYANQVIKNGFPAKTTLYAYWQFYYTSFTVDKSTVIHNRQQNTVEDPSLLYGSKYIILSSGHLYADPGLSGTGQPLTEKYGMGEFSYVIKDYKVQNLKEKGHGDVYYKDNPDVKVLVIYTLPSGPWLSTLPSMDFLTRLGNASGSGYNRIDKTLFVNLSGNPNAKSWSGTQPTDSTGMMLNLDTTTTYWTEQKKTESAKRYQTSLF